MALPEVRAGTPAPAEIRSALPFESYVMQLRSANSRDTMRRSLEIVAGVLVDAPVQGGRKVADPNAVPWSRIGYQDVLACQSYLAECGRYSASTVNLFMAGLRGVLKQCWRLGLVDSDTMMRAVDVPSLPAQAGNQDDDATMAGRRLEPGEIEGVAEALSKDKSPHGIRDGALFAVMYLSAARRAEVAGLMIDDLDLRAPSITVRHGKGGRSRTCYMHHDVRKPIRRWLAFRGHGAGPLLLPLGRAGQLPDPFRPMTVQSIFGACRRWARLAGIDDFSPHDLRRSWCTAALEAGADTHVVQRQMGHSSPTTTSRYDRRDARAQKKAVRLVGLHQRG